MAGDAATPNEYLRLLEVRVEFPLRSHCPFLELEIPTYWTNPSNKCMAPIRPHRMDVLHVERSASAFYHQNQTLRFDPLVRRSNIIYEFCLRRKKKFRTKIQSTKWSLKYYTKSIASPMGKPRFESTITFLLEPSIKLRSIFGGFPQSVQNISLQWNLNSEWRVINRAAACFHYPLFG